MRLMWLTDIHLNFLNKKQRIQFYEKLKQDCDAVLISGDIAEGNSLTAILIEMAEEINKTIYFVLGNHDYYTAQIDAIRAEMTFLTNNHQYLFWLPAKPAIQLDNKVILVGQDGWADGRYGNYDKTPVKLMDSEMILDFYQKKGKYPLLEKMQEWADKDAENLYDNLHEAITLEAKGILVLTHVPPFRETCLYQGNISDDDHLPYFGSKATGDILLKFAKEHPDIDLLVLCGHSHDACLYQPLSNLTVRVGKAEYDQPEVQGVIDTRRLFDLLHLNNSFS